MKKDFEILSSAKELKSTRNLTMLALLVALNIVIGNFSFYVTPTNKVGFGFLTVAAAGELFGPIPAMMAGMVGDIIKWLIKSEGAYFPGFTLSACFGGFLAGITLYKKKITIYHCILERVSIALIINIFLNSFWKTIYFGKKHYLAYVLTAITKNAVLLPFEIIILYLFLTKVIAIIKKQFFTNQNITSKTFSKQINK